MLRGVGLCVTCMHAQVVIMHDGHVYALCQQACCGGASATVNLNGSLLCGILWHQL
jgi:hypothetical protein